MKKRMYCFRALILFIAGILFASAAPKACFAAKEVVVLGQNYQLEPERQTLKDKFSWEVDLVYGLSTVSRLTGLGSEIISAPPAQEYLDTLGMLYSGNDFLFILGANYLVTPRLEVSAGAPASIVLAEINNKEGRRRRGGSNAQFRIGLGDAYAGISYALLTESNNRPLTVATLEANSALSKYTSLGDGFWGITPALNLRKFVSGPVYVLGSVGYTHRLKRRGVEPGRSISYSAGLGALSENRKIELALTREYTDETKIGSKTVLEPEEDLTMSIEFSTIFDGRTFSTGMFLSGLENGFNWGQNSVGIFMGITF